MIFFTSDLHLMHKNIVKWPPRDIFKDTEEMTQTLIENWNSVVGPQDTVWVLGDFAMGPIKESVMLTQQLNGKTKLLVAGNHDRVSQAYYFPKFASEEKLDEWFDLYHQAGFHFIFPRRARITLGDNNVNVTLSHFPFKGEGDHTGLERFTEFRPEDEGEPLLCGHIHAEWKSKRSKSGTLMINVGVDVWDFKPVSVEQIAQVFHENQESF